MVGRWSASSRQDIGSQRVTRAVCFTSSYTCCFTYTCAYSGASAHFNPLIAPHANRLNRVLLHTLHSVIFVSSACSRTREAARNARTRARMNGSASDSRALLDGASRTADAVRICVCMLSRCRQIVPEDTRSVCQGVVSYAVFARLECTRRPSLRSGYISLPLVSPPITHFTFCITLCPL